MTTLERHLLFFTFEYAVVGPITWPLFRWILL